MRVKVIGVYCKLQEFFSYIMTNRLNGVWGWGVDRGRGGNSVGGGGIVI